MEGNFFMSVMILLILLLILAVIFISLSMCMEKDRKMVLLLKKLIIIIIAILSFIVGLPIFEMIVFFCIPQLKGWEQMILWSTYILLQAIHIILIVKLKYNIIKVFLFCSMCVFVPTILFFVMEFLPSSKYMG